MNVLATPDGTPSIDADGRMIVGEEGDPCCCGDGNELYYVLNLCYASHNAPPDVPRLIAVLVPFTCGGCPLSSERIVIYRGYCYFASPNYDPYCEPLACAEGRCESPKFDRLGIGSAVIVNAGELLCKSLETTCQTVPCVPEEPGCCSETDRMDCPDGSFAVCNRPKRFRVIRAGSNDVKSWCSDIPTDCASWRVYEDIKIKWDVWSEFACVETGGTFTEVTCRAGGGSMTVSGLIDPQTGLPSIMNGVWTVEPLGGSLGGLYGGVSGYDVTLRKGNLTASVGTLRDPGGFRPCGFHFPDGDDFTQSEVNQCVGGRLFKRLTASATTGWGTPGTYNESEYADCFYYMKKIDTVGYDTPNRCPGLIRWNDRLRDDMHLVFVTACPDQPPPPPLPRDAMDFMGVEWDGVVFVRGEDVEIGEDLL